MLPVCFALACSVFLWFWVWFIGFGLRSQRFRITSIFCSNRLKRLNVSPWLCLLLGLCSSLWLGGALPMLAAAGEAGETVRSVSVQSPETLMVRGRDLFQRGAYGQAIESWRQAAAGFRARNDAVAAAKAWSNVAIAHEQLAQHPQADGAIARSLELLALASTGSLDPDAAGVRGFAAAQAQALMTQGNLQLNRGQARDAHATWEKAEVAYGRSGDRLGLWRCQLNQAQALEHLGFYGRSLELLQQIEQQQVRSKAGALQSESNSNVTASDPALEWLTLLRLGAMHRRAGSLEDSEQLLLQSLTRAADQNQRVSQSWLELAETAQASGREAEARVRYGKALALATPVQRYGVSLASLRSLLTQENWPAALDQWKQAQAERLALTSAPSGADPSPGPDPDLDLDFARSLLRLERAELSPMQDQQRWQLLGEILEAAQAREMVDRRRASQILGLLGETAEQQRQWPEAQRYTEAALQLAESLQAPELLYRWQWQLGRLWRSQSVSGNLDPTRSMTQALALYERAVTTLSSLQNDIFRLNPEVQFRFQEDIDPLYRQYLDLLLRPESAPQDRFQDQPRGEVRLNQAQAARQQNLRLAQTNLDRLHQAELSNFLGEPCNPGGPAPPNIRELDPTAALISPIILDDRLEVLLQLPSGELRHFPSAIPQAEMTELLQRLRSDLVVRSRRRYQASAQRLYDLIIRPLEAELKAQQIQTLVFSLDSAFNSIPMAALYDGDRFLLETYRIAATPGLDAAMVRSPEFDLEALAVGMTEPRPGFAPLVYVAEELEAIARHLPRNQVLLDHQFTTVALRDRLTRQDFPIVHIATHGQFSSDPRETFLLSWDDSISVRSLDQILQVRAGGKPLELLVLSACQTAVGDRRAALGMAGVALKAGANSTLATLWAIDDQATAKLMDVFYEALSRPGTSKAEALRLAQLKLLRDSGPRYAHPIYWSPYVLLGNWL